MTKKVPIRRCVACRQVGKKSELMRLVLVSGILHEDVKQNMPGRGAYIHKTIECQKILSRSSEQIVKSLKF